MALLLSEFHTLVSDGLSRGTSLNSAIALRTKMAVGWIERNYTFQYMREWRVLNVLSAATYPYIVNLHGLALKKVELLRVRSVADDGSIQFSPAMKQVKPADRSNRPSMEPESYWLNGRSSLIFNQVPDQDYTLEGHFQLFTQWSADPDFTHWLLDNATQLLLTRTWMMMCNRTRDPEMYQMYKTEFDLELKSFTVSEEALQSGDSVQVWEPPEQIQNDPSLRSA